MWQFRSSRQGPRPHEYSRLNLESLESRLLLSGNVQASLDDGTLSIVGDAADNGVLVTTVYDATYGTGLRVEGIDYSGATTVNGNAAPADFFGVVNLDVDLQDGDDALGVSGDIDALAECLGFEVDPEPESLLGRPELYLPGWVTLRLGNGDNQVGAGPGTVGQRVLIETGSGDDQVGLCEVKAGTNLVVRTFGGYDEVFLHDCTSTGLTRILTANGDSDVYVDGLYANELVVRGGYHEDGVELACLHVQDDVIVQTQNGYDWVYVDGCEYTEENGEEPAAANYWAPPSEIGDLLVIQTFDGGAEISVHRVDAGRVNILGGIHNDYVDLWKTDAVQSIAVTTLDGDDDIGARDVEADSMYVYSGGGDDEVFVGASYSRESYFDNDLVIITSTGNDLVRIGDDQYGGSNLLPAAGESQQLSGDDEANIGRNLVVNTGNDVDRIEIAYYDVAGNATIDAGAGDDSGDYYDEVQGPSSAQDEFFGGVLMYDMDIAGHLNVFLGSGADSAEIEYLRVGGNAVIDAGPGDDGETEQVPSVNGGYGNQGVGIYGLDVGGSFWLILGSGVDAAEVSELYVGNNAFFNAGADQDYLSLYYVDVTNNLYVYMGGGNDALYVQSSYANAAWFYGDGGNEDYFSEWSNSFGSQRVYSFEYTVV